MAGGNLLVVVVLALLEFTSQASTGCKNCVLVGKEQRAMFRAHSAACSSASGVPARSVDALLGGGGGGGGHVPDEPALRRHVYCVLLKCKLINKDGKLQKAALLANTPPRADGKNATKILESCADQGGDSPEDIAWNIFRCGYDKKAILFDYMPTGGASADHDTEDNKNLTV